MNPMCENPKAGKTQSPWLLLVALLLFVSFLGGCLATTNDLLKLQADIRTNKSMIEDARTDLRQTEVELSDRISALEKSIKELEEKIFQRIARSGELGEMMKAEMARLLGQIEETQHTVDQLRRQMEEVQAGSGNSGGGPQEQANGDPSDGEHAQNQGESQQQDVESVLPEVEVTCQEQFERGVRLIREDASEHGRRILQGFMQKCRRDPEVRGMKDDALYWIGEAWFKERNYNEAIISFQQILQDHANGDKGCSAIYMLGECFLAQNFKDDARMFFLQVKDTCSQKDPALARKAQRRMRSIR